MYMYTRACYVYVQTYTHAHFNLVFPVSNDLTVCRSFVIKHFIENLLTQCILKFVLAKPALKRNQLINTM